MFAHTNVDEQTGKGPEHEVANKSDSETFTSEQVAESVRG